jgi:hypothetical protein
MAFPLKSRRSRVVVVAAVVAMFVLWYAASYPRGVLMAHLDHARGRYQVLSAGLPVPWAWEYARLLEERYGVEMNWVAGCDVPLSLAWYIGGYNPTSRRLLKEKYGRDIFRECAAEARQRWEAEHLEQWRRRGRRSGGSI